MQLTHVCDADRCLRRYGTCMRFAEMYTYGREAGGLRQSACHGRSDSEGGGLGALTAYVLSDLNCIARSSVFPFVTFRGSCSSVGRSESTAVLRSLP